MRGRVEAAAHATKTSDRVVGALPRQGAKRAPTVTIESAVDEATARRFWVLYEKTFGELAIKAVARQLLHEQEFMAEMLDGRVDKYLAWDEHGEPVAMCTLTRHLETVPWISPQYFAHHYPDHTARDAVYYMGFILVDHEHRRAHMFIDLVRRIVDTLRDRRAVCAYDICSHNNELLGLGDAVESLITSMTEADVRVVDTQTYYCAVSLATPRLPEMRNIHRQ